MAFAQPLWTLLQFSLSSEQYSHIILIPVVTLALLYQERSKVFSRISGDRILGGCVLATGCLLHAGYLSGSSSLSRNDQTSWAVFSVVTIWLGLFLFFYGRIPFRMARFPLLFLYLMVPIPDAALFSVITVLQHASAETTDVLFRLTGMTVYREGLVFALPGITIEVARECSGIRSSMALFITSLLAGHMFLQARWSRLALYVAVLPITIFKNGLRILFLSSYAVYVDPTILDSAAHRRGGIPFFGLALLFLGAVLWVLRKTENRTQGKMHKSPGDGGREGVAL